MVFILTNFFPLLYNRNDCSKICWLSLSLSLSLPTAKLDPYRHPTNIEPNRHQMLEGDMLNLKTQLKLSTAIDFEVTCDREETAAEKTFFLCTSCVMSSCTPCFACVAAIFQREMTYHTCGTVREEKEESGRKKQK